jgi:hypothetical protein
MIISEVNNFMFNFDYWYDEKNNTFDMQFKKVTRPVGSFKEEAIRTAQYIQEHTDKPIYIAAGGGIDSELVCRAFMDAEIDFTVFTVKMINNLNHFDIKAANAFCEKHSLKQVTVELNPHDFFRNDIQKFIDAGYHSTGIYRYYQMYILEAINNLGGCCVFGAGETNYHNIDGEIKLPYKTELLSVLQWIKDSNNTHFARFFETTPEMSAAYHQDKLISFLSQDPMYFCNPHILNFQPEKIILYHHHYPDMPRRYKYIGMEGIFPLKKEVETNKLKPMFDHFLSIYIPLKTVKNQLGI